MAVEKITLEITTSGTPVVKRDLDNLSNSVTSTATAVRQLQAALKSLQNANLPPSVKGDLANIERVIGRIKSMKGDSGSLFKGLTSSKDSMAELKNLVNSASSSFLKIRQVAEREGLATGSAFGQAANSMTVLGKLAKDGILPIQNIAKETKQAATAAVTAGVGYKNFAMSIRPVGESVNLFKNMMGSMQSLEGPINTVALRFKNFSQIQEQFNNRARQTPIALNQTVAAFQKMGTQVSGFNYMSALSGQTLQLANNLQKYYGVMGYGAVPIQRQIAALQMLRATLGATSTSFGSIVSKVFNLRNALMLLLAQMGLSKLREYIDSWISYENNIKLSTNTIEEAAAVQEKLFKAAQETRMSMDTAIPLYRRLAQAQADLGATQQQMIDLTRGVGMALAIQGTSAEAAKGALLQFGQLLGMARVRAQEFNSINENTPRILQAVAQHVKGANGSIHQLREMVLKGKVTNKDFFDAMMKALPELEAEFARVTPTIGQSFTVLNNAVGKYIREIDKATGGSKAFATAVMWIGNNLPAVIGVIESLAAALATLAAPWMWTRIVAGFTALMAVGPPGWIIATAAAIVGATVAFMNFGDEIVITTAKYDALRDTVMKPINTGETPTMLLAPPQEIDVSAMDYVRSFWEQVKEAYNYGTAWIAQKWNAVVDIIRDGILWVSEAFVGPWRDALQRAGMSIEVLKNPFKLLFDAIIFGIDTVIVGFHSMISLISTLASTTITFFRDILSGKNVFQSFSDAGDRAAKAYMDTWNASFKNGKGPLAQFIANLQKGAEAAAIARAPIANPLVDLNKRPPPRPPKEVDTSKQLKAYENLIASLDPVVGAIHHIVEAEKVLKNAWNAGIITMLEYDFWLDKVWSKYEDGLNPIQAHIREMREELSVLEQSQDGRRGSLDLLQQEQKWRKQGMTMSAQEKQQYLEVATALAAKKREMQEIDRLMSKFYKPLHDMIIGEQALNKLLSEGKISFSQYRQELAELKMAAGQGNWFDGFVVGLNVLDDKVTNWVGRIGEMMGQVTDALASGIGEAFGRALTSAQDFRDILGDISRQILGSLIAALVKLGIQMGLNAIISAGIATATTATSTALAATTATAWAPAATMVSAATFGASAIAGEAALAGAFSASEAMAAFAWAGFSLGGYTGNLSRHDVAGVVHGQEFVVNADGTRKNRALLESINRGASPGGGNRSSVPGGAPVVNISVQNHSTAGISVERLSATDIRIIAREEAKQAVQSDTPRIVAAQMRDPNSRVSKSLGQSTRTTRRR